MIIAVDMDSTINNLCDVWVERYNRATDDTLTVDQLKSWDAWRYAKYGRHIYEYLDVNTYARLSPLPGAVDITKHLQDKHELVVVSAVVNDTYEVKLKWLQEFFPHLEHIIFTDSKMFVRADILIDDGVHNLTAFPGDTICFDQPWNQTWGGLRAYTWFDVPHIVDGLVSVNNRKRG